MQEAQSNVAAQQTPNLKQGEKTAWILTDGRAGNLAPARGLSRILGLKVHEWTVTPRKPLLWIPPQFWPQGLLGMPSAKEAEILKAAASNPPDILLSCGRRAVGAALALKERTGALAVHLQNPRVKPTLFDLVVAPAHDQLEGSNVEVTLGSLHGITSSSLSEARQEWAHHLSKKPSPRIAVSIGGSNKAYRLDENEGRRIGVQLRQLVEKEGVGLMVTGSRRTDPKAWREITGALAETSAICWDQTGPNPYLGYLAWADRVIVTGDSVNMVSEAAATGKPVHVISLPIIGRAKKFERFHKAFQDAGVARPFDGTLEDWTHTPPTDTDRVAERIRALMEA